MSLRKEIIEKLGEYDSLQAQCLGVKTELERLLRRYYSEKYGLVVGESTVKSVKTKDLILVDGFSQGENIDSKPSIVGSLVLPFGTDRRKKVYGPDEWEADTDVEVNGNVFHSTEMDINGNV